MKLEIDNRTGYLNDYYFQTLCLLYFPGEKFREGFISDNYAYFYLEEKSKEEHIVEARVVLASGSRRAEASWCEKYTPTIAINDEFFAMNAVGKAFLEAG